MKIAVTYENEEIFQHFGHSESFKFYNIEDGKIVSTEIVNTNGSGHGALVDFLVTNHIHTLICGGIGGGAKQALTNANIQLLGGVKGNADQAVHAYLNNTLTFNPEVHCDHHDHNHDEEHVCGDHGCGSHTCGNDAKPGNLNL